MASLSRNSLAHHPAEAPPPGGKKILTSRSVRRRPLTPQATQFLRETMSALVREALDGQMKRLSNTVKKEVKVVGEQVKEEVRRGLAETRNRNRASETQALTTARQFIKARRSAFSKVEHLPEASLTMLLELYELRSLGKVSAVTALCYAAGCAQTTALRYLGALEEAGMVRRRDDPEDQRRTNISLTSEGKSAVSHYLRLLNNGGVCSQTAAAA